MTFKKGHTIFKGRKHSEATRKKISDANKCRVFSDEWIKNLSESHKGKTSWKKGKIFVPLEEQKRKRESYLKSWKEKNKEKLKVQSRNWKRNNRDRVNEQIKIRYKSSRLVILARIRNRKYKIDPLEYDKINKEGICPLCKRKTCKNLSVDHDHKTGKIRGFICNNCNVALGRVEDSPEILRALAVYLENAR